MSRRLVAVALILGLILSGCASTPRPLGAPDPLVEDNRPASRGGGPGAWLDEHPVLETATFTLAAIGVLTVAGVAVVAAEASHYHGGGWNFGP